MSVFLLILATSLATYVLRIVPLALLRKPLRDPRLVAFIEYLPYAILTAMVVPGIFGSTGSMPSAIAGTVAALALALMNKSLPIVVAVAAVAACLFQNCSAPCSATAPIVLTNGVYRVSVSPAQAGRVMEFSREGGPNAVWTNSAEPAEPGAWLNVGGEKTWIGPQDEWKGFFRKNWPPPAFFDSAVFTVVSNDASSVTLQSPADEGTGVSLLRTVSLSDEGLRIRSELRGADLGPEAPALFAWSVCQIPTCFQPDEMGLHEIGATNLLCAPVPGGTITVRTLVPATAFVYYGTASEADEGRQSYTELEFKSSVRDLTVLYTLDPAR